MRCGILILPITTTMSALSHHNRKKVVYRSNPRHCRLCRRTLHEEIPLRKQRTYHRCLRPYQRRSRTKKVLTFDWSLIPAELEDMIMPEVFYGNRKRPTVRAFLAYMRVCKSWYKHACEYIRHDDPGPTSFL